MIYGNVNISMSNGQRKSLKAIAADTQSPSDEKRRALVLLMLAEGIGFVRIAEELKMAVNDVIKRKQQWDDGRQSDVRELLKSSVID
ncbi:MAG: hypothetical protein HRU15_15745 [Planctomycetes bacterium]|nr:hypothetical protein [Planctomycetota bacterium]